MTRIFLLKTWLLALPLAGLLGACAAPATTVQKAPPAQTTERSRSSGELPGVSREDEAAMGARIHPSVLMNFGGESQNRSLTAYVEGIGRRLAANAGDSGIRYRFFVLRSDIVNAFSVPGGYVYVTRGLLALASTEAQVASVLAHEMAHVHARHAIRRHERQRQIERGGGLFEGIFNGPRASQRVLSVYAQQQEFEADDLGVTLLRRSGYDPLALARFLLRLQSEQELSDTIAFRAQNARRFDIYSTHPPTTARVRRAGRLAAEAGNTGRVDRDGHLQAIDGMFVDGDRDNGFIKRRDFIHPTLGFRFKAPEGFALFNLPSSVMGVDRRGGIMRLDLVVDPNAGSPARYLRNTWAGRVRLTQFENISVNGLPAATAIAVARTRSGPRPVRLVVIAFDKQTYYRFMFVAPRGQSGAYDARFRRTAHGFRRLSPAEAARLRPNRLRIVSVRRGETVRRLAARMPYDTHAIERFLVLNNLRRGDRLQAGQRVKIVVE